MIPYLTMVSFWGFIGVVFSRSRIKYKDKKLVYCILAGISLFLIMSFRHVSVGTDTWRYMHEYENADFYLHRRIRASELGFSYLNYAIWKTGLGFQSYLGIVSAIIVFTLSLLYYRYSERPMLSYYLHVTIGLFSMTLTGLRQSLAISFTILGFLYLVKNRKLMFFMLVVLASLFHNTAIVFLFVYLLRNIRVDAKRGMLIYCACSSLIFFRDLLGELVYRLSPDKYAGYFDLAPLIHVNPLVIVVAMAIPFACFVFWPSSFSDEENARLMSLLFLMSCANFVIYFLALEVKMFERVSLYFSVYNTVLIANVIPGIKDRKLRIVAMLACIVLPMVQFLLSAPDSSLGIGKYKFYWG